MRYCLKRRRLLQMRATGRMSAASEVVREGLVEADYAVCAALAWAVASTRLGWR